MSAESVHRGALIGGVAAVFALRMMLSLADPGLVHPVDPAELAHLDVLPLWAEGRLGWLLDADANVHHGGFFWLGVPVGLLKMLGASGLGAVRGVAAGCAALAWGIWVVLAHRLGGRVAAVGLGLCLAVPSPWMAQWTATLWGSHSEAAIWTGLWGLALVDGWRPRTLGMLLGLGVAWDPLLWPTAVVAWGVSPVRRSVLAPLAAAWVVARLPGLMADPVGIFVTSFSENPEQTLPGLMAGAVDFDGLLSSLGAHLCWPWVASAVLGAAARPIDVALTGLWAVAAGFAVARAAPGRRHVCWLVACVVVHLAVLVVLAPSRPRLAVRYLVAWWPAVLLVPWVGTGARRAFAALPVVASACALPLLISTWSDVELARLRGYPAQAFQHLGLDRVPQGRAHHVVRFLEHRDGTATEGFAAAFSSRLGYPVWGEPFPDQVRAAGLPERLRAARETGDVRQVDRDFGFGLMVVCDGEPACVVRALEGLTLADVDPAQVRAGVTEAEQVFSRDTPGATGE